VNIAAPRMRPRSRSKSRITQREHPIRGGRRAACGIHLGDNPHQADLGSRAPRAAAEHHVLDVEAIGPSAEVPEPSSNSGNGRTCRAPGDQVTARRREEQHDGGAASRRATAARCSGDRAVA